MSVIVKGMEMPKNCRTCPMLFDGHSYRWCNITGESLGIEETDNGRDEHCPLIELPPHGRLGDLDKLEEQFKRAIETYIPKDPTRHMDVVTSNRCHAWCNGLTVIQDAPTVIEAERSE